MSFSDELDRMTADVSATLDSSSITVTQPAVAGAEDDDYGRAAATPGSFTVPACREDLGVQTVTAGAGEKRVEVVEYTYETANALVTFVAKRDDVVTDGGVERTVTRAEDAVDGRVRRLVTRRDV